MIKAVLVTPTPLVSCHSDLETDLKLRVYNGLHAVRLTDWAVDGLPKVQAVSVGEPTGATVKKIFSGPGAIAAVIYISLRQVKGLKGTPTAGQDVMANGNLRRQFVLFSEVLKARASFRQGPSPIAPLHHKSMSDPKMNPDVLSQVFETAVDNDPSSLSTIRSVNREWYGTAGSTPKLWSKLELHQKAQFIDLEYVRLHLQNAGAIPLDIKITLPDDLPYDTDMPALALLKDAVPKIKRLVINAPFHEAWQKIITSIGEGQAAPILEQLVVTTKGDVNDTQNNHPYTTFSTVLTPSPQLTYFQIPAWPIPATPPPHLSTVTSLAFDTSFSGLDIPALFPCVLAATNLEHFKFKAVDMGAESDPGYSNVIPVPKLISADVTTPGFGLDMLGNFNAPRLADVRLDGFREVVPDSVWDEADWGWDLHQASTTILGKLAGRSPEIRRLDLRYVHFVDAKEDFNRILSGQAFPALEELILERSDLPDAALIENASKSSNLKKLVLLNCKYVTVNGLRPFLEGRANPNFVLELAGCQRISQADIDTLSKLVHLNSQ